MTNENNRVELIGSEYPYKVLVDGVVVGQGTLTASKLLAEELKESDTKCDYLKGLMVATDDTINDF